MVAVTQQYVRHRDSLAVRHRDSLAVRHYVVVVVITVRQHYVSSTSVVRDQSSNSNTSRWWLWRCGPGVFPLYAQRRGAVAPHQHCAAITAAG
eukprot:gene11584-biopygen6913